MTLAAGGSRRGSSSGPPGVGRGKEPPGPERQGVLPRADSGSFELLLKAGPNGAWSSAYRLSLAGTQVGPGRG